MKKVLDNTPEDCELTRSEKINVIITLILGTLPAYLIYSFGWRKKLPSKSVQVNKYMAYAFGILMGIAVLAILISILLVAIRPRV